MIKAIIFDLNGVFIQSPKLSDRFRDDFNVSEKEFMPALEAIMKVGRLPNCPGAYSLWKPYLEKWKIELSEEELLDYIFRAEKENLEMIEFAKKLKGRGIRLFLLSNNFKERTIYYNDHFPFLKELFEKVYFSWQTGYLKTNFQAYQNLLDKNNLKPEEYVFFDDSDANIQVASNLGIKSYIFKEAKNTESILIRVL